MTRRGHARVLMYSHDTFGLGHLRRCRSIAHALVERFSGIMVLIISGSPIAGAFDFRARVDFVKVPSVIKLHNGDYTSLDQHIDLADTLEMRRAVIHHTAAAFDPDIMIVDKEPMGLRGELESTLELLGERGTMLIAGLREVMDGPEELREEWERADMVRKVTETYDHVWVYGPRDFWNPLTGLDVPEALTQRISYTGYLDRTGKSAPTHHPQNVPKNYILVTAGGGGDGAPLMNDVLSALEAHGPFDHPLLLLLGPFMKAVDKEALYSRAESLDGVTIIDFDNRAETLVANAKGIVSMCGYNTFCEILSYDRPALIVPRTKPRREQEIRARRAADLGIVDMLLPEESSDPQRLAEALRRLPQRNRPSQAEHPLELDGLDAICDFVEQHFDRHSRRSLTVVGASS
ncbi:glycosyltransferase family protein [Tepidamorphus sp. 3E244]|uniref:glycosyltransferase family protein n=1 Tax=Tepidamorphus sp. 3E244 TaxID=3385498 RepID=UPI0038FC658D